MPRLPDVVFATNGATVVGGKVLGARFRHMERTDKGPNYLDWFVQHGSRKVLWLAFVSEGDGDCLSVERVLASISIRTDPHSHCEAQEFLGLPLPSLGLANPDHYHVNTALSMLHDTEIVYFPEAFTPGGRSVARSTRTPRTLRCSPQSLYRSTTTWCCRQLQSA